MEQSTEPMVVGVRFGKVGKIYHFAADTITDIKVKDMVVVETSRGWQLGQVAQIIQDADPPPEGWKPIDRRATPRDLLLRQMWQMKEAEVMTACRDKAADLHLVGIKIVSAEYSFDGSRLTIMFSSESEEKYDLKSMRSDMQKMFAPSQVEMRQVGPRDVAKVTCGMGACGLETRCCCLFLTEFSSISIRMAKEQNISLTPTEITGMCGRLRCCLIYEYDTYVEARSKLPKRNKRVRTPQGEGKVVDVEPLRGTVRVDLPELGYREFSADEVQLVDGEPSSGQQPPAGQQPSGTVFKGTQRASEMDAARTGDERVEPFEISTENPPPPSPWENPPPVEEPRSMPRPEPRQAPGPETPARPGERGSQSERRGGKGRPEQRGQRPGGPRPGGTGPGGTGPGGQKPGGKQGKGRPRPGGRPQRQESAPQEPSGEQPAGQGPKDASRPRNEAGGAGPRPGRERGGGGTAPDRGGDRARERGRKKGQGQQRDNPNDSENGA